MNIVKEFLKDQWLAAVILIIWITVMIINYSYTNKLIHNADNLKIEVDSLKKVLVKKSIEIDSLSKVDTILVNKIKIIKQKEYVQVRNVDNLNVSQLQKYFSDHYPKE